MLKSLKFVSVQIDRIVLIPASRRFTFFLINFTLLIIGFISLMSIEVKG